ncbi:MAG: hypothetical protein ACLQDY_25480 [Streptosporangiaceae bacterium]
MQRGRHGRGRSPHGEDPQRPDPAEWGRAGFNINTAGYVIVGVFVITWIIALSVWHIGKIEQRWQRPATAQPPD